MDAHIELQAPIACEIGRTCEIQNYVDRDPGAGAQDYTCGASTYDGHDGTDFRVPSLAAMRAGVPVVAAAQGRVLRVRDGVEDASVRERGRAAVAGAECGNGVAIDYGAGWQTQYCHMAEGSLRVQPGDQVLAGQPIGAVGLSGLTEYPHLHFTVRLRGEVVDPFAAGASTCGTGRRLWAVSVQPAMAYRTRVVLNAGFASGPVTNEMIEAGGLERDPPTRQSPALVAYVRTIGVRKGDAQKLVVRGPGGRVLAENAAEPLDRDKAQWIMFAGSKAPAGGWPKGSYEATYSVTNGGKVVEERTFRLHPGQPEPRRAGAVAPPRAAAAALAPLVRVTVTGAPGRQKERRRRGRLPGRPGRRSRAKHATAPCSVTYVSLSKLGRGIALRDRPDSGTVANLAISPSAALAGLWPPHSSCSLASCRRRCRWRCSKARATAAVTACGSFASCTEAPYGDMNPGSLFRTGFVLLTLAFFAWLIRFSAPQLFV